VLSPLTRRSSRLGCRTYYRRPRVESSDSARQAERSFIPSSTLLTSTKYPWPLNTQLGSYEATTDFRVSQESGPMPSRSFTACRNRCLHPRYFAVVCTETWPRRNWICSNSPPESWQNRAHDLLRSCGASLETPSLPAYSFTTCQTTFSVILAPQTAPVRQTQRKILPCAVAIPATVSHSSTVCFTHSGIGTVRMCPPFPTRSTMAQRSSRR